MMEDNILVAVSRSDAKELLLARGWTVTEVDGEITGAASEAGSEVTLGGALFMALVDEASALRRGDMLDIERTQL